MSEVDFLSKIIKFCCLYFSLKICLPVILWDLTLFGCNRDFDEGLMQRISEVAYEDDIKDLPSVPDVGNYLVSEVILEDRLKCFHWFYVASSTSPQHQDALSFSLFSPLFYLLLHICTNHICILFLFN